jgi:hypothetical protein
MSTGKWYWELACTFFTTNPVFLIGIAPEGIVITDSTQNSTYSYYGNGGTVYELGSASAYGASYTTGDIIGVSLDVDAGTLIYYKNGVSQGTAFTGLSGNFTPSFGDTSSANQATAVANFGQDSSFAGNKTAQGNSDANGIGDFYYAPPAGFLALCTDNLDAIATPYQAYSSCGTEDEYLEVTYVGNGSADGTFINLGFLPTNACIDGTNYTNANTSDFDFLANGIKCRSATTKNVSGTTYTLEAWVDRDFKYSNGEPN